MLDTATWRANPDWGAQLGYDADALAAVNRDAVVFARELAEGRRDVTIGGVRGRRAGTATSSAFGRPPVGGRVPLWRIGVLRDAGVERITALTLSYPAEAVGVVQAAVAAGLPVVPGFTVETEGRLPDGTSVAEAIATVDAATDAAAEYYLINCAHPTHIAAGLEGAAPLERIGGLRVNASALSHAELDEAEELDEGDPVALARDNAALRDLLPGIRMLGGCCGTDHRHVAKIAASWRA